MNFKNFTLDPFQEKAITAIENNRSVVVSAPTGSGKTLIADYIIEKHKDDIKRIIYTAPIKALSNQKYKDFCKEYGEHKIGLMTGDMVVNPQAKVLIMTTEIYRNMVVSRDAEIDDIAYVVFDEIHFINDSERGYVWEESIIYSPESVRFLCLSATIPNANEFSRWIRAIKKHPVETVVSGYRHVPLEHLFYDFELGITSAEEIRKATSAYKQMGRKRRKGVKYPEPDHIELIKELLGKELLGNESEKGMLPVLFFSFSRRDCQSKAKELARRNLFGKNPQLLPFVRKKLEGSPSEINRLESTQILKETIVQGIAFHHAGLLPVVKEIVEELFSQGKINVLYTTETFAVGINMPAKTVCFNSLRKYDGYNFRYLSTKEYFQIAGRAGRRGMDKKGYVVSMIYRPTFNYEEVKRITAQDTEPINSQFRLSVNTILNLINLHMPKEIEHILRMSFFSFQKFGEKFDKIPAKVLLARYYSLVRKLNKLNYIKGNKLTEKGFFSAQIFADEITMGEIFATGLVDELNEYQILLVLAALVYEPRMNHQFKKSFKDGQLQSLKNVLLRDPSLAREKKFNQLLPMSSIIHPAYYGQGFFTAMSYTNLLEGDLIRMYAQIIDRLTQVKKAAASYKLQNKIENCIRIIDKVLEGIYRV
ncbi:MAG: DEAD/DEAH box helicase [Nanoarchaeota archaeon]